jgi:SAM-dependent methyltransferase
VWAQDFFALDLPPAFFDGIFANASLFHVPVAELPRVLGQLHATLKPGGVLFCSNPHGHDEEGWNRGRYGTYLRWETWRDLVIAADFAELHHYYRPPGLPREEQPWLASVWRAAIAVAQVATKHMCARRSARRQRANFWLRNSTRRLTMPTS